MTYSEQIKHPKWQKKRLEILERDQFTCQNCDSKEDTLHVHHYIYRKNSKIWEYDNSDLITFCEDCHSEWHEDHDMIKEYLKLNVKSLKAMKFIIFNLYRLHYIGLNEINNIIESVRAIRKMD